MILFPAGLVGGGAVFFDYASAAVTCYIMARFSTGSIPAQERLQLLDRAAERGQISEAVARKARERIEKLRD